MRVYGVDGIIFFSLVHMELTRSNLGRKVQEPAVRWGGGGGDEIEKRGRESQDSECEESL
jgi:hypothetical protein